MLQAAAAPKVLPNGTAVDPEPENKLYGNSELIRSQNKTERVLVPVKDISKDHVGQTIWVRGRVYRSREQGNSVFIVLRQSFATIQVPIFKGGHITKGWVKWAGNLTRESIVEMEVTVQAAEVASCTQTEVEIVPQQMFCISPCIQALPFNLEDAARSKTDIENPPEGEAYVNVLQDLRLDNRCLDIRTPANQAIFRIQSHVCRLFREFTARNGFTEIHSPKIIPAASESGASVFKLGYFGEDAFLAQSPQLYKQMALSGDLERVCEIGPVFRAENSNTHRHLCEFTGMDIEMTIKEHYHEVLEMLNGIFVNIFDGLNEQQELLAAVNAQYPFEPLVYPREMLIISFAEGIQMLRDAQVEGWEDLSEDEDIGTTHERQLGGLVKEKYGTDFYCMDKFPVSARPFYTMLQEIDGKVTTNSYDIYIRGEEILSGAQRVHDPEILEQRIKDLGLPSADLQDYIDAFKLGVPPHGGGGIGLERVVMLFLGLPNIRLVSLFPRTPIRNRP